MHISKALERDLGLPAVLTISIGAMIGSGIFVLPGLGFEITGPSIAVAYLLAGLVVLPAALSKSEIATAMPEAGGTYLYVDRAMGPLMGTIAGVGVWFSLVFKAAFALVGLGAYLRLVSDLPAKGVALALATILVVLNIMGVKIAGRFQTVLVVTVVGVLVFFVFDGVTLVENERYRPFLTDGFTGLLAATGLIFVSYAGVTKVASLAEEIERPERNLPVGILGSLAFMMLLYPALVFVVVGVTPDASLTGTLTPLAEAASSFLGEVAVDIISITAVLALVSMANAGLLSSSRYPFAMSRNSLAPKFLQYISPSRGTPAVSIAVTGGSIFLLIAFVPIIELAKLASAFQLLVFSLVNIALIAFRESRLETYKPQFRSPGYPWVQVFGILAATALLSQLGWIPIVGAAGIIIGGVAWYQVFGKGRLSRDSASFDALRLRANFRLLQLTDKAIKKQGKGQILIPINRETPEQRQRDLIRIASRLIDSDQGSIQVMKFEEVPEQIGLQDAADHETTAEIEFQRDTDRLALEMGAPVEVGHIVSHDRRRAVLNYVRDHEVDLVLADMPEDSWRSRLFAMDLKWLRDNIECDSIFLRNRALDDIENIVIMGSGGPYDALKVSLANRIAVRERARIRFVHLVNKDATDAQIAAITSYHFRLDELCDVATVSEVERAENLVEALGRIAQGANLVILGAAAQRFRIFSDLADRIAARLNCSVLLVHAQDSHRRTFLGKVLERLIY